MKLRLTRSAIAGLCLTLVLSGAGLSAAPRAGERENLGPAERIKKILRVVLRGLTPVTNDDQVTLPKP
jgi:hypothetical protein